MWQFSLRTQAVLHLNADLCRQSLPGTNLGPWKQPWLDAGTKLFVCISCLELKLPNGVRPRRVCTWVHNSRLVGHVRTAHIDSLVVGEEFASYVSLNKCPPHQSNQRSGLAPRSARAGVPLLATLAGLRSGVPGALACGVSGTRFPSLPAGTLKSNDFPLK